MADLKTLYTPREATALYNLNKIKFNPMAYTLKEHLILNRSLRELAEESILVYGHGAENGLVECIKNAEPVSVELKTKLPITGMYNYLSAGEAEAAAVKEYNLSIALEYLVRYGSLNMFKLKGNDIMDAIVRMLITLDSDESCAREMYWFITELWNTPYAELHAFAPLKNALQKSPLVLPISLDCGAAEFFRNDILSGTAWAAELGKEQLDDSYAAVSMYKAYFYTLEVLWAYYRLNDSNLQRAIAWWLDTCDTAAPAKSNLFNIVNGELKVTDPTIEAMVKENDTAKRFEMYQQHVANIDTSLVQQVVLNSKNQTGMNPALAMFISYAENCAVTHVRVNTICLLYNYCKEKGYSIDEDTEEQLGLTGALESEIANVLGSALSASTSDNGPKNLMELNKPKRSGDSAEGISAPGGTSTIFEALDNLSADFEDGGYFFKVKDVRVSDPDSKPKYEQICSKVSLMNKNLIQKIKAIKTYNTGGKNPGESTGRVNRKAVYRYKYDPNIFYKNTYKQLESDLAFGIILDMSGSMSGQGIADGKVTMIVLHETLKALGINHSIIGHTSRGGDYHCDIERYQAFKEDKTYSVCKNYALVELAAHSCNCDSGALYYMERAMDRVQNKDKIVLIFSDGYPTACTGTDLINQVHAMEAKGIKVIGIGVNFDAISKYYTDYANGRNLQDMLNIVTNILQEYILKKKDC